MGKFMRLDYFKEGVPDATTLLKFRHLLERHELQKKLFDTLNGIFGREGENHAWRDDHRCDDNRGAAIHEKQREES
jgi:IS5 family transposase